MIGFRKSCIVTGVVAISLCAMVANSKVAKIKRDSDSLYENIYSAIADFTDETNQQADTLPVQKRQIAQSRSGAGGSLRTGRQTQTRQVIVDGFPSGLPDGTPEGVKIALASMQNLPPGEMPPIPGEAGVDFPIYASVPQTSFDCDAQTFPGIYADTEADCQVFFMCQPNGNFNSFLCPNGTVFNQQYFICDWWYNFDCSAAPSFYGLNEFIYQDQPEGKKCNSLFCQDD